MQTLDAWGIAKLLGHIDNAKANIAKLAGMGSADDVIDKEAIELHVEPNVLHVLAVASQLKLQSTYDRVWEGGGPLWMAMKTGQLTYGQAEHEMVVLRQCIEADLEKRVFGYIEPSHAELFRGIDQHWKEVLNKVPDSKTDIEEAHVAYMAELYTATVFHAMRIAEYGLRFLAKKLRVSRALKHKGQIIPIDHAEWQQVIDALKNKISKVAQQHRGPKRSAKLEKLSDAADHCVFIKDIWRNAVSHTRKPYNEPEAKNVLDRVRDFMQFVVKEFAE